MMISVALCKINEKIYYLSIFYDHVVGIWFSYNNCNPGGPVGLPQAGPQDAQRRVAIIVTRFDCAIDRQNYREIVTKIRGYRCYAWNI